jgi:hypothetical protein
MLRSCSQSLETCCAHNASRRMAKSLRSSEKVLIFRLVIQWRSLALFHWLVKSRSSGKRLRIRCHPLRSMVLLRLQAGSGCRPDVTPCQGTQFRPRIARPTSWSRLVPTRRDADTGGTRKISDYSGNGSLAPGVLGFARSFRSLLLLTHLHLLASKATYVRFRFQLELLKANSSAIFCLIKT